MKAFKSLEAHNYYTCKVQTVYYHALGYGNVLKALVTPSQRLSEMPH